MAPRRLLSVVLAFALTGAAVYAEGDETPPTAEVSAETSDAAIEEADETQDVLDQLSVTMVSQIIDERTVVIREKTWTQKRQLLRMGNVAAIDKFSMSDEDYEDKLEAGKDALKRMLGKHMIMYKIAAPEHQPPADESSEEVVLGDMWTSEGKHINGLMLKEGHVVAAEHYQEELARDILQAEAEKQKEQSYKELEEAIKESDKEKKRAAAAEKAEIKKQELENEPIEPMGFAGWTGILVLGNIVGFAVWAGLQKKKKVNPNRKRGPLERIWMKMKGA